ncbi:MAG: hypothetical protein OQK82_01070 [Candidatus Pacearchaeota archaeon]|nr:hypothetical protein [Candidatus Pacearchaeota archaeon]
MTEHSKQAEIIQIRPIQIGTLARVRLADEGVMDINEMAVCYKIRDEHFYFLFESGAYREFSFIQAVWHLSLHSVHPEACHFVYTNNRALIEAYLAGVFDEAFDAGWRGCVISHDGKSL